MKFYLNFNSPTYCPYFEESILESLRSMYVTENASACWKKRGGKAR